MRLGQIKPSLKRLWTSMFRKSHASTRPLSIATDAKSESDGLHLLAEASLSLGSTLDLSSALSQFANLMIARWCDWCEIVLLDQSEKADSDSSPSLDKVIIAHADPKMVEWALRHREAYAVDWQANWGMGKVLRSGQGILWPQITNSSLDKAVTDLRRREALRLMRVRSAVVVPLRGAEGQILGGISLIRSSPDHNFDEKDLALASDLAARVAQTVVNAQLCAHALEANRAKSAFLASISHELRTPLSAMMGFADLLAEGGDLSPKQTKYVQTIVKNGRQLLRLVDEILDLTKVESNAMTVENIEFSLPVLLEEIISLLEVQAREKNLEFRVHAGATLPDRVTGDPKRLRQVLINVIGNAIKFTTEGSIDIHLEYRGSLLEVRVRDTGVGIAPPQRERLFQPFVQADTSVARRFGGSGLGLHLSRRIARLLGGDVVLADSSDQQGSEFIVTARMNPVTPAPTAATTSQGRVLIVDDSPDNCILIQHYVSRLGYLAETASSGREAVARILTESFDVVLMDVQMPEMDGFEAVQELRRKNYRGPIVALTAHTMKGDRERCLENGFDDFLGKPIDRVQLKEVLTRAVGARITPT